MKGLGIIAMHGEELHLFGLAISFESLIVPSLALAAALYFWGAFRNWRSAGGGRGIRYEQAGAFAAGLLVTGVALASPLEGLVEAFFSAHMIQHMLLMLVAAPLITLGAAPQAFLWALPRKSANALARGWGRSGGLARAWGWVTALRPAVILFAGVVWVWHAPAAYQAALESQLMHAFEHITFLLAALLFWWAVLKEVRRRERGGALMAALGFTMFQMGLLGGLINLARERLYPFYEGGSLLGWRLTALEDQQLAGLVMWLPGGILFFVLLLLYGMAWLEQAEERSGAPREM